MPRKSQGQGIALPTLKQLEAELEVLLANRPANLDVVRLTRWIRKRDRLELEIAMRKPLPQLWKQVSNVG